MKTRALYVAICAMVLASCSDVCYEIETGLPEPDGTSVLVQLDVNDFYVYTPDSRGLTPSEVQETATADEKRTKSMAGPIRCVRDTK